MTSVCFRFDDPSAISDHDLERRIFTIFARHRVPLCVAAIPFAPTHTGQPVPLSPQNAPHLIEASRAGVIDVAQHGHSHIHRGAGSSDIESEFVGLSKAEQARLIREGAQHLAGVFGHRIKGFVPPWNTCDLNTARALDEAGFDFLSAGWEVFRSGQLAVIPRTCTLRNARSAILSTLRYQSLAPVLVVVLHPDDFAEFKFPPLPDEPPPFTNLRDLESLLVWITTTSDVNVDALSNIAASIRKGIALRNPAELNLPDRVRVQLPPMLVRSDEWKLLPGILWGALRSRFRMKAEA